MIAGRYLRSPVPGDRKIVRFEFPFAHSSYPAFHLYALYGHLLSYRKLTGCPPARNVSMKENLVNIDLISGDVICAADKRSKMFSFPDAAIAS